MSTGLELLRRLQKQQHPQQAQQQPKRTPHNKESCGNNGNKLSVERAIAPGTTTTTGAAERASSRRVATTTTSITTIEVCLGPDCSGSGGGAALLEIEELVSCRTKSSTLNGNISTMDKKRVVVVIPGGCRDFCTMGPNVHVRNATGLIIDAHYSKVDGPEACRTIVASALGQDETTPVMLASTATVRDNPQMTILRKREDGIRWRSHRKRAANERRLRVRARTGDATA